MGKPLIISTFFDKGTSTTHTPEINKRIVLTNYILAALLVIHPLAYVIDYLLSPASDLPFLLTLIGWNFASLLLNRTRYHKAARILTVSQLLFLALYFTQYYDRSGGMHLVLITTISLCFTLFDIKGEWLLICAFVTILLGTGVYLELSNYNIGTSLYKLPQEEQAYSYLPTFIFCAIGSFLAIYWLSKENARIQKDLELALIKAQEGEKTKSEFLSTMSHEIRTPLNGILGLIDLMKDEKTPWQDKIEVIHESSQNLKRIVNDILDYSKIEAGKLEISNASVNIESVLNHFKSIYSHLAKQSGIEFNVSISEDCPTWIQTDGLRLKQILQNLLNNAFKFTDRGQIDLFISYSKKRNQIKFAVKDTGIGIKPEKLESIFNRFNQINSQNTRNFEGAGLGLAICKLLSRLMKGSLNVKSTYGEGSTFTLVLPYYRVQEQAIKNTPKIDTLLQLPKILFVEDNDINQFVMHKIFDSIGVTYTTYSEPQKALEHSKFNKYDLIITDYHMPELNGISLACAITNDTVNPNHNTPILLMTADVNISESELGSCVADVIIKPVKKADLIAVFQNYAVALR